MVGDAGVNSRLGSSWRFSQQPLELLSRLALRVAGPPNMPPPYLSQAIDQENSRQFGGNEGIANLVTLILYLDLWRGVEPQKFLPGRRCVILVDGQESDASSAELGVEPCGGAAHLITGDAGQFPEIQKHDVSAQVGGADGLVLDSEQLEIG